MSANLGQVIQNLLKTPPLDKLSEDDKMITAGLLGGAMRQVMGMAEAEAPYVSVHIYEHPAWDMKLILAASPHNREQALENISDDDDASLLTCRLSAMTREEFRALPEWDG